MKRHFSRRLSPRARRAALLGNQGEPVGALLQAAASAQIHDLKHQLEQRGAKVGAWMEETRLLAVEVDAPMLESIAEIPGVVYVDMATTYRD